jgi:Mor family transcriptional regulator
LQEALTKSDKDEIERIARKEAKSIAQSEIEKVVGKDFTKSVGDEVKKILKDKATKKEIATITKTVIKKLYQDLSFSKQYVIDQIKV